MTARPQPGIRTEMVRAAHVPLRELLALREAGDTVLDHCLRRVAESAAAGTRAGVAAFNASPPRRD